MARIQRRQIGTNALYDNGSNTAKELDEVRAGEARLHTASGPASVPAGARVASLTGRSCGLHWALRRNAHLGAMVIVRRHGFSNDQWIIEGTNLLTLRYTEPGVFAADSSQIVRPTGCRAGGWWIDRALRVWPRDKFDYIWLIDPPPYDEKLAAGMRPVWRGPDSVLYQVKP